MAASASSRRFCSAITLPACRAGWIVLAVARSSARTDTATALMRGVAGYLFTDDPPMQMVNAKRALRAAACGC
jgi:hypothetical protein